MSYTGRVCLKSIVANGDKQKTHQYKVTVRFDIAFDYSGWNNYGSYYQIGCGDAAPQSGTATYNIPSGNGSWVWANIGGDKTFTITMDASGKSKAVYSSAFIVYNDTYIQGNTTITLPAITWAWTVSYNANGGSGAPGSQTKTYGTNLTLSTTKPSRTGYTFLGWSTSSTATSASYAAGATFTTNANTTLYAVWKVNTYTISYNGNGTSTSSVSNVPGSQTKTYGTNLTLSTTKPSRTGYTFLGWSTSSTATSASYAAGATFTTNANTTLYAVWKLAFWNPTINNLIVARCTSAGTLDDTGTYCKVSLSYACCQLQGVNKVKSVVVQYAISGSSSYSTAESLTATGTSGTASGVIGGGKLSTDSVYIIKAIVTDSTGASSNLNQILSTTAYTMDFKKGGTGVAIGKAAVSDNLLDIALPTKIQNTLTTTGDASIGGTLTVTGRAVANPLVSSTGWHNNIYTDNIYNNNTSNNGQITIKAGTSRNKEILWGNETGVNLGNSASSDSTVYLKGRSVYDRSHWHWIGGTANSSTTFTANLSTYSELLLSAGVTGTAGYRSLSTLVIPITEIYNYIEDHTNGCYQTMYGNSVYGAGLSRTGTNTFKLYRFGNAGYASLYAR